MIGLQLYVENQLVEMFDDESITLTQTIQDVRNIDKIFSDLRGMLSILVFSLIVKVTFLVCILLIKFFVVSKATK